MPQRPDPTPQQATESSTQLPVPSTSQAKKKKNRGGKKRRNRRQSFAPAPSETSAVASNVDNGADQDEDMTDAGIQPGLSFYQLRRRKSHDSIDSDVLLDHRSYDHQSQSFSQSYRPRKESKLNVPAAQRATLQAQLGRQRSGHSSRHDLSSRHHHRRSTAQYSDGEQDVNDRTPLMPIPMQHRSPQQSGYGLFRSTTRGSSASSKTRHRQNNSMGRSLPKYQDSPNVDVNNPPSVPGSPSLNAALPDPMLSHPDFLTRASHSSRNLRSQTADVLIDIDNDREDGERDAHSAPPSPRLPADHMRQKRAMTFGADVDVCFPADAMSEMAEEDFSRMESAADLSEHHDNRRRRKREWPQLWVLDEWSREEKEARANETKRVQRVHEPVMIDGRLRPSRAHAWHREENAPFRYTYFNKEFEGTIHAQTISELVPQGGSFRDLFIPDRPELDESSSDSEDEVEGHPRPPPSGLTSPKSKQEGNGSINPAISRINSVLTEKGHLDSRDGDVKPSAHASDDISPHRAPSMKPGEKPKKFGPRPTFWLDVTCPTDQEMRVIAKAFSIHALTSEDILMQEAREKVELFKNYYFINYRTFEQDKDSEDYLEPVNVYIVVFRYGILTFHFSQIPHPANVRRRIRQLKDYLILSADWISYAIIDDITDIYVPMIHNIEAEVDDIDEEILRATPGGFNSQSDDDKPDDGSIKEKNHSGSAGYHMLRRVGETRKKVMSLYRLLGNKADVIKGFAKRCNEQWDVAPKTEIGLYLGDIQDHILTMTSNLSHYENLLSRAHSNYLAQVSIRMNERSEQTSDVLSKLTVLGTIVLPMNIICGMWGMNVKVPGQDIDNLWWFWGSKFDICSLMLTVTDAMNFSHGRIDGFCRRMLRFLQEGVWDCIAEQGSKGGLKL